MKYPTLMEVELASRIQLARWVRHLASPVNPSETLILDTILNRFEDMGGWTPAISKAV